MEPLILDDRIKGIPGGTAPFPVTEIAAQGWNVLREDLPLPIALLKDAAVHHNSRWMQRFVEASGAHIAPHGKTTMSPELFKLGLDDGAWGLTLATVGQLQVARRFGINRVLMANQLVGKQAIRYVLDELAADPEFFFTCLVDSHNGVELLADAARAHPIDRPLTVLLEGGLAGGRTGCRDFDEAIAIAEAVKAAEPHLTLGGIEGYEGVIRLPDPDSAEREVRAFLRYLIELARQCDKRDLFAPGPVILSAGGSVYYDYVADEFSRAGLGREVEIVSRGGCYVSHDSGMYRSIFAEILQRSDTARELGEGLTPALEVWAYVQSRPEGELAILTLGKRDISYDVDMPFPLHWYRPEESNLPHMIGPGHEIIQLNDQHAYLKLPAGSPLRVGDMVACGISHPCTTFDKWRLMYVVNDGYDVVSAVTTYF